MLVLVLVLVIVFVGFGFGYFVLQCVVVESVEMLQGELSVECLVSDWYCNIINGVICMSVIVVSVDLSLVDFFKVEVVEFLC